MSENIPRFRFGDYVRIMQTTAMEQAGLANRYGTVSKDQLTPSHLVRVALDDKNTETRDARVNVPAHSLMRTQHHYLTGAKRSTAEEKIVNGLENCADELEGTQ